MDSYGYVKLKNNKNTINGVAGDQQAALFGQGCIYKGDSKMLTVLDCSIFTILAKTRIGILKIAS